MANPPRLPTAGLLAAVLVGTLSAAARPRTVSLASSLPGDVQLAVLADPISMAQDLPAWLVAALWKRPTAQLLPPPLQGLALVTPQVALGLDLAEAQAQDVVVMVSPAPALGPVLAKVAAGAGVSVQNRNYRGVLLREAEVSGAAFAVSDLADSLSFVTVGGTASVGRAEHVVDTMQGRRLSVADRHGLALTGQEYLVSAYRFPVKDLGNFLPLPKARFDQFLQGTLVLTKGATGSARLGAELVTSSSWKARLLSVATRRAIKKAADMSPDPELKAWLEKVEVVRDGSRVQVFVELPLAR